MCYLQLLFGIGFSNLATISILVQVECCRALYGIYACFSSMLLQVW